MVDQRELQFEEDQRVDYVQEVITCINSGDYSKARVVIAKIEDTNIQLAVRRTVAAKTNVYL